MPSDTNFLNGRRGSMEQSIVYSAEGEDHSRVVTGFGVTDSSHLGKPEGAMKKLGGRERLAVMARCPVSDISQEFFNKQQSVADYIEPTSGKTIGVEVSCSEREMSDSTLKEVFSSLSCETTALQSRRVPLVGLGRTLFTANCTLKVASERNSATIIDELESKVPGIRATLV